MSRFLKALLGIALIPFCGATAALLYEVLKGITANDGWYSLGIKCFVGGMLGWCAVWMFLPHPTKSYVLAHELTHAVWGLLFGAKIGKLKVTAKGGSVQLSKSNLFITLAPYFFPFYTAICLLAAAITRLCMGRLPCPAAWLAAIGATWCFHVCFTFESLKVRQPDICEYGRILSYATLISANLLVLSALLVLATTAMSFATWALTLAKLTAAFYASVFRYLAAQFGKLHFTGR